MNVEKTTIALTLTEAVGLRIRAYFALVKVRLTSLVVFSAVFGYMMAPGIVGFDISTILWLVLGGFLVTGASNTFNQVLEVEFDRQMTRTQNRPLVKSIISPLESVILGLAMGVAGIWILGWKFEGLVPALLGIIALLSYAFVYTPMKRISPIGVLIGAFPGAMPPLIGYAAATGGLGLEAWVLFLIQFIWQFPHFWAIGWVLDDDYKRAGFKMLPGNSGRSAYTASMVLIYTTLLIPASILPWMIGMTGTVATILMVVSSLLFTWQAYHLLRARTIKSASRLMFGSFLYLPVVQISLLVDKF